MARLAAFWGWATTRPGVIIVLAIIVAAVLVVAMALNQDAELYDAVIELFRILVGGGSTG